VVAGALLGGVRVLVVVSALALLCPLVPVAMGNGDGDGRDRLAWRLLRLDPGARIGGNTQVAATPGVRLQGVPRRVNFILGLGPGQRIVGGARHDELGVRGAAGRIFGGAGNDLIHGGAADDHLAGGRGRDLIYGGPGRDRLSGGPGRDRLVDTRGATSVHTGSGRYRVDVADGGGDDRVLCAASSAGRIEADRGDRIAPACRSARVVYLTRPSGPPAARAAQIPVTGDGSNDKPYESRCFPVAVDCAVKSFAERTLERWWSNEYVPAYRCPPDHPYLLKKSYAPFGTLLPFGVAVDGLGPVGVSIAGMSTTKPPGRVQDYATGTLTGGGQSSATNWNPSPSSYKVILNCTSDPDHGYPLTGPGYV
jgi:RTX calcium-binding nonapeptide repeat (4 copies)